MGSFGQSLIQNDQCPFKGELDTGIYQGSLLRCHGGERASTSQEALAETNPACTLLGFQPPELWGTLCVLYKAPSCGVPALESQYRLWVPKGNRCLQNLLHCFVLHLSIEVKTSSNLIEANREKCSLHLHFVSTCVCVGSSGRLG